MRTPGQLSLVARRPPWASAGRLRGAHTQGCADGSRGSGGTAVRDRRKQSLAALWGTVLGLPPPSSSSDGQHASNLKVRVYVSLKLQPCLLSSMTKLLKGGFCTHLPFTSPPTVFWLLLLTYSGEGLDHPLVPKGWWSSSILMAGHAGFPPSSPAASSLPPCIFPLLGAAPPSTHPPCTTSLAPAAPTPSLP